MPFEAELSEIFKKVVNLKFTWSQGKVGKFYPTLRTGLFVGEKFESKKKEWRVSRRRVRDHYINWTNIAKISTNCTASQPVTCLLYTTTIFNLMLVRDWGKRKELFGGTSQMKLLRPYLQTPLRVNSIKEALQHLNLPLPLVASSNSSWLIQR